MNDSPELSIVVVVFNMRREAPKTLYSLSAEYQRGVSPTDYEVVVVDNGSDRPLDSTDINRFGENFSYRYVDEAHASPAAAVNMGVAGTRSKNVGIMIDGARIASPGVLELALRALRSFHPAVVGTVGFHLGPDIQTRSIGDGYDRLREEELLREINWEKNGYRLFEVSALAGSSSKGWFGNITESNLIFLPRSLLRDIGGFDERFDFPGGGFVNLDFYKRAAEQPHITLITLLGEATFHQMHGGVITNRSSSEVPKELRLYADQYRSIRGQPFTPARRRGILFGQLRSEIARGLMKSCDLELAGVPRHATRKKAEAPEPDGIESVVPLTSDDDDRACTGSPSHHNHDAILSFKLLTSLGLRKDHLLLDFGCDSPNAGRILMNYLGVDRYRGIVFNRWFNESGTEPDIRKDLVLAKRPKYSVNNDFDMDVFGERFDFIVAQSVFRHVGRTQLRSSLRTARDALRTSGILVASFVESSEDLGPDEWAYPELNHFSWATIGGLCSEFGLHSRKLYVPRMLQTWFVASADFDTLLEAIEAAGIARCGGDQVLT